ncbi:Hypothetical protein FKW44_000484 [Caligus rogercresseyi]|uniref:Uncharacterized protein n=1 Tax=Caligus rogercresseyi TaxID=217165 RepID=A0A7T8QUW9_CALRO|nr:Hypothetical protein FKW44_000484 [Caligus rogercresseyi]
MGPHVLPNTIGLFWGYKSPANGPLGSAKPNRGVLGLTIHHQWTLRFRRTQSGCFGVTNPPPMGPWVLQNLIGVFWGYKSTANGPSGSAEHNQGVWGYKPTANGLSGSAEHTRGVWGYKPTANWPPGSAEHTRGVLGLQFPANGTSGSAKPNRGVLGLHIPRQWVLGFHQT